MSVIDLILIAVIIYFAYDILTRMAGKLSVPVSGQLGGARGEEEDCGCGKK